MLEAHDQEALLAWFDAMKRDLPWRRTNEPWHILLSEILLQQTQVSRGVVYYERMVTTFPTVKSMAEAPVDAVLKAWEGAGYYSRARRLHQLAQCVMLPKDQGGYGGELPETADALLSLPGIGPYTAAAVASIAHGEAVACVDGNIRRVMARTTAQASPTPKAVQRWADSVLVTEHAGDWNQALMELGATVCTPKRVQCKVCPLSPSCAGQSDPERFPTPNRQSTKDMVLTACVRLAKDGTPMLEQRPMEGLFAGLWGPVYHEGMVVPEEEHVHCGVVKHALSHRKLTVQVMMMTDRTETTGVDVSSVALSSLDEKVLALARQTMEHQAYNA